MKFEFLVSIPFSLAMALRRLARNKVGVLPMLLAVKLFSLVTQKSRGQGNRTGADSWYDYCIKEANSLAQQIIIGMLCGLMLHLPWILSLAFMLADGTVPDSSLEHAVNNIDRDHLVDTTFYASITEEIVYHGIVLPFITMVLTSIASYFRSSPQESAVADAQPAASQVNEQEDRADTAIKHGANICTALLFASAHKPHQQGIAFFGGLGNGALTQKYGLCAAISQHATWNACAYVGTACKHII